MQPADMRSESPPAATRGERIFLSLLPPGDGQRTLALAVVLVSAIVFAALAPFATVQLAPVQAFIPIYQSALAINELITAVLLFGQASILRSRSILVLAAGYLFTALIVIPHTLSFPGLFAPTGLLGAGPQSTAWIYMYWHVGFPIAVLAYALLKRREDDRLRTSMRIAIPVSIALVVAIVVAFSALATVGQGLLPPIMQGNHYTPAMIVVVSSVWVFSLVALGVLWIRRPHTVLDLWLMVVMCAWMFDVALSAVLNAGRFDLGFYAGRVYGLMAASFVLLVLLLETRALYARLARSLAAERAAAESRAEEAEAANRALQRSEDRLRQLNETLEAKVLERTRHLEAEIVERERTQEQLREHQKVEAIGRLAGGMAHDFNNLLTIIQGHLDVLMDDADEKAMESLKAIDHASENGARMTRQLLTFSRRKEVKLEVIDLRWKPEGMDQLLRQSLRGDIRMVVAVEEEIWPVECDAGDLEMALMNLCVNARDAMPNGGLVRIEGRNFSGEISDGLGNTLTGDFVAISVLDTGMGIPPGVMTRVFEPFFTTKEAGKGTGLGLSQVFGFAHQSGGLIAIDSVLDGGTTVTIYLPRSKTPAAESPPPGWKSRLVGRGIVLLVEDDDDVAAITIKTLAMLGYEAHHVREAGTALALLLGGRQFVLVLSDIVMPGGLSGLEFGHKVRRHFPSLPILLASGYSSSAAEVSEAGFAFIAKPFRADGLADVLRRTIEASSQQGRKSA
jgi:signal transduction histidine kinase/CheY-like chemotaxis protein